MNLLLPALVAATAASTPYVIAIPGSARQATFTVIDIAPPPGSDLQTAEQVVLSFRCSVPASHVMLLRIEGSSGPGGAEVRAPMWPGGSPRVVTAASCARGELRITTHTSKRDPDIPYVRAVVWIIPADARVRWSSRETYPEPRGLSGKPRPPDLVVDEPVSWRGTRIDLTVSRDLAIGLMVLWLLLIVSAIELALRRGRRGGVGLSTALPPEECARRLAARDAEERPDRWIAATISSRVKADSIRVVHRPQGALTSLLLVRFLLPLYLLRSNPFAPVIYDGRMSRTPDGTSIDGRFRMNRFAYVVAVWFIAGSIVTVIGFLVPWGGIWQWPWDVPEVATSFFGSVALLVVSALVVGASRYAGASSRTEVLSYLLRELDAQAVQLAQSP